MSDTTVKVGQVYRSNDKRDHFGRWVKVVGFLPGSSDYAQIRRVDPVDGQWVERSRSRVSTIRVKSLGTTWQTGYTLVDGD